MAKLKLSSDRKAQELKLLYELSQILDYSLDLKQLLNPLLESLADHLGLLHATVALLNRQKNEIVIECAHGLTSTQRSLGHYRPGEGVTGKVVQTGRAAVIKKTSESPIFVNRTKRLGRDELSFICVPIKSGRNIIGTLSADRYYDPQADLEDDVQLLTIIASLIAHTLKLRQAAQEQQAKFEEENERLRSELKDRFRPANIVGNSREMQEIYNKIAIAADNSSVVLIQGEAGTGKELIAQAIHYNGNRSNKSYLRINCAIMGEHQLEGELFGYARGSNPYSEFDRKGALEIAQGGTIYLDEVNELPHRLQAKILEVIERREFERIGGTHTLKANVRMIAAITKDSRMLISTGQLREDLWLKLNVFPIVVPALRQRKGDILQLSDHFLAKYSKENAKDVKRLSSAAIDMLYAYHWPGNVRELENVIEWAVLHCEGEVLHAHHLPPTLQTAEASNTETKGNLQKMVAAYEKDIIIDALKSTRGNISAAARTLQTTERILGYRIQKLQIKPKQHA